MLNYWLGTSAFTENDTPDSVTLQTSSVEQLVAGIQRTAIDTQGIDDSQGLDAQHVQQMVRFMRAFPHGVNGVALVINVQHDRFDEGTKKLIRLMHNFFNCSEFWNHVAIVFTKCFRDSFNKDRKRNDYRAKVQQLVAECCGGLTPQLPCYFLNTKADDDADSKGELAALHAFVVGLSPLSTQQLAVPHAKFFKVELEKKVVEKGRSTTPIMATRTKDVVHRGSRRYGGVAGPKKKHVQQVQEQYVAGQKTTITYTEQQREVQTHYDNKTVTYGDWNVLREWTA